MNEISYINELEHPGRIKLQIERIRFLYHQAKTSLIGHLLSSVGVTYIFYDHVEKSILWSWFASILFITITRQISVFYFLKKQPQNNEVLKWGWFFTFMVFLTGCAWGAASYIFLLFEHTQLTLFIIMVLTGMLVASLASLSVFMWAYYAFALPTALPLIHQLVTSGRLELIVYGLMITLFLFVQLGYARVNQKTVDKSIILRNENLELIEQLQREKENAEQLRKEAEAANTAKTQFLASASHDLRQPLHAMGLFIDVLAECSDEEERKKVIEKIRKSGLALEGLLESLLDISKLDAGAVSVNIEPFKLHSIFDEVISEFESIAKNKNLTIKFIYSNIAVISDKNLVGRILRNLISNAIKYTEHGKILIGCRRKGNNISICVCDTGSGFTKDKYKIIFTEFHQLENPERDRSKGLGLGLAIVKRIEKLLNTNIHVNSIPNKGSIFSFELPVYHGVVKNLIPKKSNTIINNFIGKHIVIIDDEEDIRKGLTSLLSSWGCRVTSLSSTEEIKTTLNKNSQHPDLIVADYRLRDKETGADAIHEIKNIYSNTDLPAVIITGDTAPERIKEAKASGYKILHKPVSGGKLRAILTSLLSI